MHIPKTGGSSIEDIVWPKTSDRTKESLWMGFVDKYNNPYQTGGLQHLKATQIKTIYPKEFKTYFKFSIVRNPWDRAVSQFHYMKRREDLRDYIGLSESDSFETYIEKIQERLHIQWESQIHFLEDEMGNSLVDFIGRFEDFESTTRSVLKKIKLDRTMFGVKERSIPHSNKSTRSAYPSYYNESTKEAIFKLYKEDIARYGYSF